MRAKRISIFVAPLLTAVLAVMLIGGSSKKAKPVDYEALAEKLVNQCGAIHEGDYVLVSGSVRDIELLEDIAVNVRKAGAYPLLTVSSGRLNRKMFTDVPAKYDSVMGKFDEKIYDIITARIFVSSGEDPSIYSDIPPERFAAVNAAYERLNKKLMQKKFKQVQLGNDFYPTDYRAKSFGITTEQLSEVFWKGVNVDYLKLHEIGANVKAALLNGNELHITNPDGTDLRMQIKGRKVLVSDGVISKEDESAGTMSCIKWLPAGEVYFTPIPESVDGKVVEANRTFLGKEVKNFKLEFKGGKLTGMTAESGLEELRKNYDAYGQGKELFGAVDIGINPHVQPIKGSKMVTCVASGMVSVNIGGNDWAGGDNTILYSLASYIPGSTVTLDGKLIIENGKLKF